MKKKGAKENQMINFLRNAALIEAVVVIILIAIAFSTKNAFLFKVLFYVGIITALFAMSLLFLKFTGIISNPEKIIKIIIEKKKIYTDGTMGYIATSPQFPGILVVGENTIEDTLLVFSESLNCYMKSVIKRNDKINI